MNPNATNLWEWLSPIEADERVALCATAIVIGLAALVLIVAIIATATAKIHRARLESALKQELLDRGMQAGEIAEIIEATAGSKRSRLILCRGAGKKERENAYAR